MTVANRSTANRLIAAKGLTVTLTRQASGAYDPATGAAAITTTTQTGKGVILPFSAGLRHLAGTNIAIGDKQLLLSALKSDGTALTAPQLDDKVSADGVDYTITNIAPLSPAGLDIMYDCTIRAAA
jgi:hypothetical protein